MSVSRLSTRRAVLPILGILLLLPLVSAEDEPEVSEPFAPPVYLRGVDLSLPSQEAFRGWPSDELRQRPYWLPWDSRAFRRADLFRRPVLLVLTNRWNRAAQRMMQETLSDPEVIEAVNRRFISVLVYSDRRPDVHERYFTGAWPTVAFLLGDGNPVLSQANEAEQTEPITMSFVAKEQFLFLTEQAEIYLNKWPDALRAAGHEWAKREAETRRAEPGRVDGEASEQVAAWLLANADRSGGGFGVAPKFLVSGLVEYGAIRDVRLLPAVRLHARTTIEKLVASPLYDRRHGGVHRIATAPDYGGIQYEKLLDRQAALLRELVFAVRLEDDGELRGALASTARWTVATLGRPDGGFHLAQVADPTSPDGGGYWSDEEERTPPPVDRLVLSGPNALAGAALLRTGALLGDESLVSAGRRAIDLVRERAYLGPGRGVRHVVEPAPDRRYYLVAQADVAFGFVDAYEATGDPVLLETARDIVEFATANLKMPEGGGLRDALPESADFGLLRHPRRPLVPNVRIARTLRRLAIHFDAPAYDEAARSILSAYAGGLGLYGVHGTEAGLAVEEMIEEPMRVRIEGDPGDPRTRALRRAALASPWSWTVVTTGSADGVEPAAVLSWRGVERRVVDPGSIGASALELGQTPPEEPGS